MLIFPPPVIPKNLPLPDPDSASHGIKVQNHLIQQLQKQPDAFLPFDQWMDAALYAPGLGYYAAGSTKFGGTATKNQVEQQSGLQPAGDFTTAPELSPLFGQTLARQIAQILQASQSNTVLEFGAGSGALAASVIKALREYGIEPHYQILELSADLRERQQQRLITLNARVDWLDALPESFTGCVIGNELLDAMPARLFQWQDTKTLLELGVTLCDTTSTNEATQPTALSANRQHPHTTEQLALQQAAFCLAARPADGALTKTLMQRMTPQPGYQSEINTRAEAWVRQMGTWLKHGAALLIDYGFPQHEYYHPHRTEGTLMCHFRHQAHSQPLIYPGLQDITTHVDFTAIADAALAGGLDVLGYTSQARFLLNLDITSLLASLDPNDAATYAQAAGPVQKLLAESEMGELFKVMAVGRGLDVLLDGFAKGDRRHRLES